MKRRVLLGSIWLIAIALVVSTILSGVLFHFNMRQLEEEDLRNLVAVLATNMAEPQDLQQAVESIAGQTDRRATIISLDGQVLADSAQVGPYESGMLELPELVQASVPGVVGYAERTTTAVGQRVMYAAMLTPHGYYLRLAMDYSNMWTGMLTMLPALLVAGLLVFLLLVPVSHRFTSSMLRPLGQFSSSLNAVMEGGEKLVPEDYPYEELQGMAAGINRLSLEVEKGLRHVEKERGRMETILNSMREGFVMLSWDEQVLLINDAAARILQYVHRPETGNLLYMTRDLGLLDAVAEVKKTGTVRHVEYESVTHHKYEVIVSPSLPEHGSDKQGIVLILNDMSAYQSTAKMRQDFFHSASHELKTPITSVRGFAEILQSGAVQDEETRAQYASMIIKEIRRMEQLIEDILLIARMESGEIRYEREDMDFYDVVESCCEDVSAAAEAQDITLRFEGEPCRMYANPKEMVELVGNLVTNAVKYNYQGGRVEVTLWEEDGSPILNVYNTGDAISDYDAERIFERFYRLDKGRTRNVGGTGLGLAIVKHIAGQYGAKVSVIPHPGEGNSFQVVFPPSIGIY